MILALMTANTAGYTKRAITTAIVWGAYCTPNGIAPLIVKGPEAPEHYPSMMISLVVLLTVAIVAIVVLRIYLQQSNKRREAFRHTDGDAVDASAFSDLTDKENPNFRYTW